LLRSRRAAGFVWEDGSGPSALSQAGVFTPFGAFTPHALFAERIRSGINRAQPYSSMQCSRLVLLALLTFGEGYHILPPDFQHDLPERSSSPADRPTKGASGPCRRLAASASFSPIPTEKIDWQSSPKHIVRSRQLSPIPASPGEDTATYHRGTFTIVCEKPLTTGHAHAGPRGYSRSAHPPPQRIRFRYERTPAFELAP